VTTHARIERLENRAKNLNARVYEIEETLERVQKTVQSFNDVIVELRAFLHQTQTKQAGDISDGVSSSPRFLNFLFGLPKHLQVTFLTLQKQGVCQAGAVAEATGKARAIESSYLNSLVVMGFVTRLPRAGRKVCFKVNENMLSDLTKSLPGEK
jgi:hypothetical protein